MANIVTKKTTITDGGERSQTLDYIIYLIFGIIEILLIFRLVFKLTGANPVSSFVSGIYSLTNIFIAPFFGIFPQATTAGVVTTAIFEPATVVALVFYAVIAWGITQIAMILSGTLDN